MTADRIPAPAGDGCRHEAAALLGAWAVGACSDAEERTVLEHLAGCPLCQPEALRLRQAAGALATIAPPPDSLRSRVLARARTGRRPAPAAPPYAAPYAGQVSALDALLADVAGADWSREVLPQYGWSVQDLVAHLSATDGLVAAELGVPVESPGPGADDVDARTAAIIGLHRGLPPERTRAAWRGQADALCAVLSAAESNGRSLATRQLNALPLPLSVKATMTFRAFETWIHLTDIAAALGRPLPPPLPEHIHPMADLGVQSLPLGLLLTGRRPQARLARVVLNGPGGGEWLLGLDAEAPPIPAAHQESPDVTLMLDVMEFCFLAGGRRDPLAVPALIDGDETAGRALLAAAPAFAGP